MNLERKPQLFYLPLAEFEELLEDLEDLAVLAERQSEPTIPHQELIAELERDGLL
jgi:hypothetical protein